MIRIDETEFSAEDVRRIQKQIIFLEKKAKVNQWPKLAIRTFLTVVAVSAVFVVSHSPLWSLIPLIVGVGWTGAVFDLISYQRMLRESLAYERSRLEAPRKKVITVENCSYIDYGEIDDEGVLFLFTDGAGNWLMLEGQAYYPTANFPSLSFSLIFDSKDALLDISSDLPFVPPIQRYDPATKKERQLYFGMIDHAIVQASNENEAIARLKMFAEGVST